MPRSGTTPPDRPSANCSTRSSCAALQGAGGRPRRRLRLVVVGACGVGAGGGRSRLRSVAADDPVRVVAGVDRLPGPAASAHPPEGAEEATDGDGDEHE
jgi:hypothetical protein